MAAAADISVVAAAFIALPLFAVAVLEDFATRLVPGRLTDDPFTCARKVRSQDRQPMHPCLRRDAVLFLPLAIARQGRRRRRIQSRLTQQCGQARMGGATSLHERMGIGIAIGTARRSLLEWPLVGLGWRLLDRSRRRLLSLGLLPLLRLRLLSIRLLPWLHADVEPYLRYRRRLRQHSRS